MQSDGSYSALSPVVHGDIALSINTIQQNLPTNFKLMSALQQDLCICCKITKALQQDLYVNANLMLGELVFVTRPVIKS